MSSTRRPVALLLLGCLALAPLAGYGIAEEPAGEGSPAGAGPTDAPHAPASGVDAALPLSSIVLFSSGVGHFVHDGTVEGDRSIALSVPVDEMNDFLKSLTVQDFDGGTVGVVRYGSREPLDRALRSYDVDLSDSPNIPSILDQVRGERVEITAERSVSGSIVSVTSRTEVVDGVKREISEVNLNTAEGLLSIGIDQIRRVRFVRPELQAQLEQAIATLGRDRQTDTRQISLQLTGTGARRVRIAYVRSTPVWKTSYRLSLGRQSRIQAWAIVENTTGRDWRDVSLSLVTGAPVSFRMNLYDPVYVDRPEVPPPVRQAVRPQSYEQDISRADAPRARSRAEAPAPAAEMLAFEGRDAEEAADLSRGVTEQSTARDLGAAFAYEISTPVTIERYGAALVPIVNRDIEATKVSIYDQSVLSRNPLLGAEIVNTTGVHLMPGPITVFDDGTYAGDAQVGDVAPGSTAFISFAVDLEVEVSTSSSGLPEEIRQVRIIRGTLEASHVSRRTTTYAVVNRGDEERVVVVQHPKSSGWSLTEPARPDSETDSDYRFRVSVQGAGRADLTVRLERVQSRTYALSNLDTDRMRFYIDARGANPAVRASLERIIELQAAVSEAAEARRGVEQEIQQIHRDQERIRANMESLDTESRLYERYVSTLDSQEDRLEELASELESAREREAAARDALNEYVSGLTVS